MQNPGRAYQVEQPVGVGVAMNIKVTVKECFIFSNFLQNGVIIIMSCGNENSGIYSKHEFTEDLLSITRKQGSCHLITTPNFAYVMTAHVFSNIFIIFIIDPSNIILKWLQLIVRSWLAGWRCGVSGALDRTEYQVVTEWSILHCLLQPQHTPGTTFHLGLVYIFRLKLIIQFHLLLIGSVL